MAYYPDNELMTRLSRFFLYCVPFCILIVLANIYFPFIGGKLYFFRTAVTLSLISFFSAWAFEATPQSIWNFIKRVVCTPVGMMVGIFAGVFVLACIFAFDPHAAFWSNFERGEGGFQMLHYFVFFVLLAGLFTARKHWRVLFAVSTVAAIGMTLYGLAGAFWPTHFIGAYSALADMNLWHRLISSNGRFQGSLGNPDYVAPYLIFATFYALWMWLESQKTWLHNTLFAILLAWYGVFFLLSQTRGGFLGLAAAIVAALAYLAFSFRGFRVWAGSVLVALLVIGGVLFSIRNTPFVASLPGSRLLQVNLTDQSFKNRIWNWDEAWKGFKERPVLGWGPENYPAVFDKFFDTRNFSPVSGTETWFDRAHSVIFDYIAETGLLGLLAFLGIFVAFYIQFFKWRAKRSHVNAGGAAYPAVSPSQEALLFALPIGYFVQGLVLFDVLPTFMNLLIFLAFSIYIMFPTDVVATLQNSRSQRRNSSRRA